MSFSGKRPDLVLLYLNSPCLKVKHVTNKKLAKTGQNDEFLVEKGQIWCCCTSTPLALR